MSKLSVFAVLAIFSVLLLASQTNGRPTGRNPHPDALKNRVEIQQQTLRIPNVGDKVISDAEIFTDVGVKFLVEQLQRRLNELVEDSKIEMNKFQLVLNLMRVPETINFHY